MESLTSTEASTIKAPKQRPTNAYVHKPLSSPRSYRILQLEPGEFEDDVWFSVKEYQSSDDDDQYLAISYAWETTVLTHTIYSPEGHLPVTANLHRALRQCRRMSKKPINVWADAVCIRQDDLAERGQQVQLMSTIFAECPAVILWLGEESDTDKTMFDHIKRITENLRPRISDHSIYEPEGEACSRHEIHRAEADGFDLQALTRLLERPWFSRLWTYQEVTLAQKAIVSCGSLFLSWGHLIELTVILITSRTTSRLRSVTATNSLHQIGDTFITATQKPWQNTGLSFLNIVRTARFRGCTDPSDRIYGVLGIATEPSPLPYPPDYTIPVDRLYEDFARHVIAESKSLEVFGCCLFDGPEASQASWAPDWRNDEFVGETFDVVPGSLFRASNGSQAQVFPSVRTSELVVRGFVLDKITQVSGRFLWRNSDSAATSESLADEARLRRDDFHALLQESLGMLSAAIKYGDQDARYEAWWRTIIADTIDFMKRAPHDFKASFQVWERALNASMLDMTARTGLADEDRYKCDLTELRYVATGMKRRFSLTEGGMIGWVSKTAQEGDLITILLGSSTPVVIRPTGDAFFVIGQCYMHGVMDGEAMTEKNLSRLQPICLV